MRAGAAAICVLVAACSFDGNRAPRPDDPDGAGPGAADGPPGQIDAIPAIDSPPPPPDAAPAVDCPGSYNLAQQASRYRLSPTKATWANAEADCADDSAPDQWTHLIALSSDDEWSWLTTAAALTHPGELYAIGVVRDMETPAGPWRTVTGGNAPVMHWRHTLGPDEPNNAGSGEPVVAIDTNFSLLHDPQIGGYLDVQPDVSTYYACECDGLSPINATY